MDIASSCLVTIVLKTGPRPSEVRLLSATRSRWGMSQPVGPFVAFKRVALLGWSLPPEEVVAAIVCNACRVIRLSKIRCASLPISPSNITSIRRLNPFVKRKEKKVSKGDWIGLLPT